MKGSAGKTGKPCVPARLSLAFPASGCAGRPRRVSLHPPPLPPLSHGDPTGRWPKEPRPSPRLCHVPVVATFHVLLLGTRDCVGDEILPGSPSPAARAPTLLPSGGSCLHSLSPKNRVSGRFAHVSPTPVRQGVPTAPATPGASVEPAVPPLRLHRLLG